MILTACLHINVELQLVGVGPGGQNSNATKAELLSARCFATPASIRNVPECRAIPNCFV